MVLGSTVSTASAYLVFSLASRRRHCNMLGSAPRSTNFALLPLEAAEVLAVGRGRQELDTLFHRRLAAICFDMNHATARVFVLCDSC